MLRLCRTPALLAGLLLLSASLLAAQTTGQKPKTDGQKQAAEKGTHTEQTSFKVTSADGKTRLQTLCVDSKGRVVALVAPPRYFSASATQATSEVHVFTAEGKAVKSWKVKFHAQSINTAPDGSIFVAGDGKVARFDKDGKSLTQIELPHIKKALENKDQLKKDAEAQIKLQKDSFKRSADTMKKSRDNLAKIPEEKRTALQKKQLQQYELILKSYASSQKYYDSLTVESVIKQVTSRLGIISGVAISKKDVFVVCGETKGYGYVVWRMTHDFKEPKKVLSGLSGCCGQMDVQCCGNDLLVAENTRHRYARYDRDGKSLGAWGKRGKDSDPGCFGGCCNPMNVRACVGGDVLTAESEGIIKRFDKKGGYVGMVGYAPLTGGCKNVAVAISPDGAKVYMADQPGSRVIVLSKKK